MQKIVPCLWFDTQAEEAANFYVSQIKNSKMGDISYYDEDRHMPAGTPLTVTFQLHGQEFMALNGGPHFQFNHAISFVLNCETQQEVDELWEKLAAGGQVEQCGWLRDKYGVSWQIVPTVVGEMMRDRNRAKAKAVMDAILKMVKLDIATLQKAYYEA